MFTNYLKIAWRNLIRSKAFTGINILGLALGLACSLLIMLWVQSERTVDAFHQDGEWLYQVYERQHYDGNVNASYATQGLLAEELKKEIPEVQYASALESNSYTTFEAEGKLTKLYGSFADADFFSMFSYPLAAGTPTDALNTPEAIAISRKMAELFFGSPEHAIGKTIRYENREDLRVTAVFENISTNSSQQFDYLRSWQAYVKENQWVNHWGNTSPSTFIKLRPGSDVASVRMKVKDFIYRYTEKSEGFIVELALQPYIEKYLHSTFKNGETDGGRIAYVKLFTVVAFFILLIACINFMNLATARATRRAKEVGIRKVIGATRRALIRQFTGEAMLLTFISLLAAIALVVVALPAFNTLIGKELALPMTQPVFWIALTVLLLLTGLVAGSYPAFFLSRLNPIRVLKGSLKFSWSSTFFRKGLVVFQFTLSIALIVSMIVIDRQVKYVQSKNLGYDRENLIYLPIEGELTSKYSVLKDEALSVPGIRSVSKMRNSPTRIEHHTTSIGWAGKDPTLTVSFADGVVGYDFVKTMNLKLIDGRDFSKDFGVDTASYIINETAAAKIGFKNPVGQIVHWGRHPGMIIGVLKDFHFNSMHNSIEPLILRLDENWNWGTILVRTEAGKTKEALSGLETLCKTLNPKFPFTYDFSDEQYARLYKSEQVVSTLSNVFAALGIFISCLGLFGLASFSTAQRTKEIGVRKVLGATVPNIVMLLATTFLKPVFLAIVIAIPLSAFAMNNWLEGFAYKIEITWWMYGLAAALTLGIALATVSFQSIKSALANPVKSLRTE